ncbi:penicillin-binding protein 2 [Candidatus Solirubrobacter pratensis]|uniref:penicillin-binding protein 2 n=1 Tax=Candidatus Solirubrobacter pratensis TaxID=1298857 RepID=UPI00042427C3|nr:penicillin-binding protein 2 [Candidatus Solirubrobacter pratensis]
MPQRVKERVPPITPQLAWRVAVLGGTSFVLFGIVFFRLWFLQVLSGEELVAKARQNRVRKIPIEAPRGNIVDRNNETLVKSKVAAVVQLLPNDLPDTVRTDADKYRQALAAAEADRQKAQDQADAFWRQLKDDGVKSTKAQLKALKDLRRQGKTARKVAVPPLPASETALAKVYGRISRTLADVSPRQIQDRVIRGLADAPYSNVTIKTDITTAEFNYIKENPELFPGVVVETQFLREFPHDDLAAQLFGTVNEISETQRKEKKYAGVAQGTRIGQSGLEERYDRYLRGKDGYSRVVVNAMGTRDDQARTSVKEAVQGQRLKLTLDFNLQQAGDRALKQAISKSQYGATAGAYVAVDPTDGAILAMGSQPSFDANVFARPFSQKTYKSLTSDSNSAPLLNRATESAYPTGSVFKPVTALAALSQGLITPDETYDDTGHFEYGTQKYQNAKAAANGPVNMVSAIKKSSDTYFFRLGSLARGRVIQQWAARLGFGRKTGLDLPGEHAGLVPDKAWRDQGFDAYTKCREKRHFAQDSLDALYACGGIDRPWTGGDNVNLAVGQGDLQATPLQVAVAYSALANGGTIVRPHVGSAIEDGLGRTVQELHFKSRRKVKFDPTALGVIRTGLHEAVASQGGTSYDVFKGWDQKRYPVFGKTGTAERGANPDQAWYACWVMDKNHPIVVVVTIEKGGFGAETAAPAARLILSQWFDTGDRQFHAGASQSN